MIVEDLFIFVSVGILCLTIGSFLTALTFGAVSSIIQSQDGIPYKIVLFIVWGAAWVPYLLFVSTCFDWWNRGYQFSAAFWLICMHWIYIKKLFVNK